ncbi:MAG: cell wall hydrolase/autolysin [Parcubacteria group bacterium Gr01-1014_31]|nr:MAG: cell wall hydrolase/autolysin [Parcubacteria group bacterium Gr01-1014_31]
MHKLPVIALVLSVAVAAALLIFARGSGARHTSGPQWPQSPVVSSEQEVEFEDVQEAEQPGPQNYFGRRFRPMPDLSGWRRPEGPWKVALQVGHWKTADLPEELGRLRERGGGTSGGGKAEWQVNLAIAEATKDLLEANGMTVEILPATIPASYWADVIIAIHADGSGNPGVSGFKAAAPRRDYRGRGSALVAALEEEYGRVTGMRQDANITRNMTGYYAFNWRRYEHAIHPMTVAAIMETGFLTSPRDQRILIRRPEVAAQGIAAGIRKFLEL